MSAYNEPKRLAEFLLKQCLERGVHLHHPAKAIFVGKDMRNELSSVRVADLTSSTETDIPCTRIIITAGAWSALVFKALFRTSDITLPIASLAGHSLVIKSPRWVEAMEEKGLHSVYTTSSAGHSPEILAWKGGRLFLGGVNSAEIPLPALATQSKVLGPSVEELKQIAAELLASETGHTDYEIVRQSLCFRPVTPWGLPIIAGIPDEHLGIAMGTRPGEEGGVFVAAGHGPWGISMSLGTGKVLAELVQGREPSADISHLGLRQ
ncbi:uncharacterized protein E0L32_005446 [Thyridium curvatum]|uniref:FAD dependent oxidoreductase domain-containing protein n=1 Tax=Thyridium curvatum TaxID=1093900 RepID=A0A507AX04_9PEZI|nr:uncharacterized protein E0L32_005446 [Thyridium curvatum]TPX14482.1 hypothetical protein E0L32_005446 [Thyridium curvatum]